MTDVEPPTPSELMREVQRLIRQVESLIREVRSDYVRKDVYDARYGAALQRVIDLETKDVTRERDAVVARRQVLIMVASIAIPAVLGLLLSLYSVLPMGVTP